MIEPLTRGSYQYEDWVGVKANLKAKLDDLALQRRMQPTPR